MQRDARLTEIVSLVRQRGYMSIDALPQHLDVTPQTIRRDINDLSAQDLLQPHNGGAGLNSSGHNTAYAARQVQNLSEKRRIAELCATHIPGDSSLFINIGTTNEEPTRSLLHHSRLRLLWNRLHLSATLFQNRACDGTLAAS